MREKLNFQPFLFHEGQWENIGPKLWRYSVFPLQYRVEGLSVTPITSRAFIVLHSIFNREIIWQSNTQF